MSASRFVDTILENEIKTIVIPSMFPSLNAEHRSILEKYIIRLINIISICFGFNTSSYVRQLKQNKYQDIKWLIMHMLPFINEANDPSLIKSFDDIYTKKKKDVDINKESPEYLYSNIQYNRFNRDVDNYTERKFNIEDLNHNFYLLLDTVKTMSNKMHANWMDIFPYTMTEFESSLLFDRLNENFIDHTLGDWDPYIDANLDKTDDDVFAVVAGKTPGLYIGDIYNTIVHEFYESIRYIKWTIYDVMVGNKIYTSLEIVRNFFGIVEMAKNIEWNDHSDTYKTDFIRKWEMMVNSSLLDNSVANMGFVLPYPQLAMFLKGVILSFDKRKKFRDEAIKSGYIKIKTKVDDDDDSQFANLSFEDVKVSLKSVGARFMYEFFRESIQKIKDTWYGFRILQSDKLDTDVTYQDSLRTNNGVPLTCKNVYNFAKSLCHYTDGDDFIQFPKYWKTLTVSQKNEILKRLNSGYDTPTRWFSIPAYIRYVGYDKLTGINNINEINVLIYDNVMGTLPTSICQALIAKGVLTTFIPNPSVTDLTIVQRNDVHALGQQKKVFERSEQNVYWTNSYHYLTHLKMKDMKKFRADDGKIYDHFSYNATKKGAWYTAYAYDWVAQIGFCHHFINNRVTFITGATGVGKSTEIPKLFLYYSKAIDYNPSPKIVCTQPRKAPASTNAERVSTTLGVPIYNYDGKEPSDSDNYYIQMKYRDAKHTKQVSHGVLKYITDGTLLLEVNDPILKVKYGEEYGDENVYDVIMIDEAHEHKLNMDILLSILKIPVALNNSLRLVVLSATMDEDEPKYRRFYRDVNDNLKYPIDNYLKIHKFDRINVDRRFHISPPGMGTKFKVNEVYLPNVSAEDAVLDIVKRTQTGDILMFQPGKGEIMTSLNILNQTLPSDVIALPYYGEMKDHLRKFIEKIDEKLKTLRINKSQNFLEVADPTVGSNVYKRAVLIATNAAEASITIPSLRYVVDTGNQKTSYYDYTKRGSILLKTNISESSRIQRKGRVGRTASGTVYYLYEKGSMEKNRINCEIASVDLFYNMFQLLKADAKENVFIDSKYDPNCYRTRINLDMLPNIFREDIATIIQEQYFIGGTFVDYYGNDESYDYSNYSPLPKYYSTGFDCSTLTDNMCSFYLVHPNEMSLNRNIGGDVVGITNNGDNKELTFTKTHSYKGMVSSKKIKSFWKTLLDYTYIECDGPAVNISKTNIGINLIKTFEKSKLTSHNLFRSIFYSASTKNYDQIVRLVSLYSDRGFGVKNIMLDPKGKILVDSYENNSDSQILLKILDSFHKFLSLIGIHMDITNKNNMNEIKKYISSDTYTNFDFNEVLEILGPVEKFSKNLRNKIIESNVEDLVNKITLKVVKIIQNKIVGKYDEIQIWCNENNINVDVVLSYVQNYMSTQTTLFKIITPEIIKLSENITKINPCKSLECALVYGYPFNICKKINNSNYYLSLYTPVLTGAMQIQSVSKYKNLPNTFVPNNKLEDYVLYLNLDIENDSITILHKIVPSEIMMHKNIYNNKYFEKMRIDEKDIVNFVTKAKKYLENTKMIIGSNLTNAVINYGKTIELIRKDFLKNN